MKRLVSFLFTAVVVVAVAVAIFAFAHHNGPGDSPRDDNNTKTAPQAAAFHVASAGVLVRV